MTEQSSPNPAEYSIRRSAKARRINLRVLPGKGLEVVLPQGVDEALVPALVQKHTAWIERALKRLSQTRQEPCDEPPAELSLKGGRERVTLVWQTEDKAIDKLPDQPGEGVAPGSPAALVNPAVQRVITMRQRRGVSRPPLEERLTELREWVREEARAWLGRLLHEESDRLGLPYSALRVRFQKSRWGSCSIRGNINLNACLLFLPEALARYIIVHELCHTRAMNHSPSFWKLVFAADPDALAKDRAMRRAWKHVPWWVFAKR